VSNRFPAEVVSIVAAVNKIILVSFWSRIGSFLSQA
jgi:hypothetical protein